MYTNPFYHASELTEQTDIIGRDLEAAEMSQWLKSGNNIRLLGPRRIGKTTFLNKLAYELENPSDGQEPWTLVKIDLSTAFSSLAVIRSIIDATQSPNVPKSLKKSLNQELRHIEKTSGIGVALKSVSLTSSTKCTISPAETEELIKRCLKGFLKAIPNLVIAFDEFQNLLLLPGKETHQVLSVIRLSLMSNSSDNSAVLVTGSIRRSMDILLSEPSSPLLHQLQHYNLKRIHKSDWIDYLSYMFEATGKIIDEESIEYLVGITKGHSLRTKQLAANIWQNSNSDNNITINNIDQAWSILLSEYSYEFQSRISEMGANKEVNSLRFIYSLVENGWKNMTAQTNIQKYGFTTKDGVTRSKEKMINLGIIEQVNGEYIISDPLFESHLKTNPMLG